MSSLISLQLQLSALTLHRTLPEKFFSVLQYCGIQTEQKSNIKCVTEMHLNRDHTILPLEDSSLSCHCVFLHRKLAIQKERCDKRCPSQLSNQSFWLKGKFPFSKYGAFTQKGEVGEKKTFLPQPSCIKRRYCDPITQTHTEVV